MSEVKLTIAIPTYNSIDKMVETIESIDAATDRFPSKVIFVDDHSTDNTYEKLQELAHARPHWFVTKLDENSGSAARPRNRALELVETPYIFFLDSDDVVIPEGLEAAIDRAVQKDFDVVRSTLTVRFGDGTEVITNRVPGWDQIRGTSEQLRAIAKHQSLTCSAVFKVSMLRDNNIWFNPERRIGEDIVFSAKALKASTATGYQGASTIKYIRAATGGESVTQKIDSNQFADFVRSWTDVEDALETRNVSFVKEHGFAALSYAIRQFIWFGSEPVQKQDFELFRDYCRKHATVVGSFPFRPRIKEVIDEALAGNFERFNSSLRIRLLIAGHDLKFLKDLMPLFEEHFDVQIDQWQTNNSHDESQSEKLLETADLIWAEWMLGAAAWYSQKVKNDQRLVVRAHRTEMDSPIGLNVNIDKVAAFISVSPHTLGDFADRFDIPRHKFHLIPNALDVESYRKGTGDTTRKKRIGMVGFVPRLKRFDLALELLAKLREKDPDFELHLFGKQPEELDWLMRIEREREFFEYCKHKIKELDLQDAVIFRGWADMKLELGDLGAVITTSDVEGWHVGLGEAYCAEIIGVSRIRRGVEACYPAQFVFENLDDMARYLEEVLNDDQKYKADALIGRTYMEKHYDLKDTWEQIMAMVKQVRA